MFEIKICKFSLLVVQAFKNDFYLYLTVLLGFLVKLGKF